MTGRAPQQPLDAIEESPRDAGLALQRQRLRAAGTDDGDLVGVDVEPGVRTRDVVGDDEVDVLPLALRRRARDDVVGFGGEADEQRSAARRQPPLAELGEDVGRLLAAPASASRSPFGTFCGAGSAGA